ncbi:MAG: hypothetical protein OK454_11330 [Thaumarchaeota archaeon]|nr:hypothetical protein [Nitrososphaerota archaeon]
MPLSHRVGDDDVDVRPIEAPVVVPPIPDDDVSLLLRLSEYRLVVDPGEDDEVPVEVPLVLLPLFHRHMIRVQVLRVFEALDRGGEVVVGHGMPDYYRLEPALQ